jgi:hypothetical protein
MMETTKGTKQSERYQTLEKVRRLAHLGVDTTFDGIEAAASVAAFATSMGRLAASRVRPRRGGGSPAQPGRRAGSPAQPGTAREVPPGPDVVAPAEPAAPAADGAAAARAERRRPRYPRRRAGGADTRTAGRARLHDRRRPLARGRAGQRR